MKTAGVLLVFSILSAVAYAVIFHNLYPFVPLDGGIVTLCSVAGIATCLLVAGIWKLVAGGKA
ncbi:MAG: hypothetical protein QOD09_3195 [Bradyrhizobium sp.]|jgi:Zn-dependent protease|nr:hypothetical protein [Bradyrhizobium sp.]